MKKQILIAAALASLVLPAHAAEVEEGFNWTGLYVGLDASYQLGGGDLADAFCDGSPGRCLEGDPASPNFGLPGTFVSATKLSDVVGGGHVGFHQQFDGGLVLGAELNIGFGGTSTGDYLFGGNFGNTNPDNDARGEIDVGLTGAARLQAGYAIGRFMPYVNAGLAGARFDATYSEPDSANTPRSGKGQLLGWTVGAGLKYAVNENFLIGAQYVFTNYGSADFGLRNSAIDADTWAYRADLKTHDLRISASYKF